METSRREFLQVSAAGAVAKPTALPKVPLGSHQVSRLILGANPFYGFSHFNKLFSQHMVEWSTPENVCATLRQCEQNGIDTWQFSHNARSLADIKRHRAEGGSVQFILLSSREMEENPGLIAEFAKLKPLGIVHHGGVTDRRWRLGQQDKIREFLKRVRDAGVLAGLSTHNPVVVESVEEQNWDVDFFMTALYQVSRTQEELQKLLGVKPPLGEVFLPDDPPRMCRAVRQSKKTCLAFKILAAGRVTDNPEGIDRAFRFALGNIKPRDAVIVGMYPRYSDQVAENAARARRFSAG